MEGKRLEIIWILFVVIAFIVILVLSFRRGYTIYLLESVQEQIDGDDLIARCKPGDVIGIARTRDSLKTTTVRMAIVSALNTDIYHTGIIGVYKGQKYFYHIAPEDYSEEFKTIPGTMYSGSDVLMYPLEPFLKQHMTNIDCVIRYYEMDPHTSVAIGPGVHEAVEQKAKEKYTFRGLRFALFKDTIKGLLSGESRTHVQTAKTHYCSSFIGVILEDLGLLPISSDPLLDYTPKSLHKIMYEHPDIWKVHTCRFANQPIPKYNKLWW